MIHKCKCDRCGKYTENEIYHNLLNNKIIQLCPNCDDEVRMGN